VLKILVIFKESVYNLKGGWFQYEMV
jgi:hypothetical protein